MSRPPIDRRALVSRHDVVLDAVDPRSPLGVGNGDLAVTVDATGLQSLPASYPVSPRDESRPDGTLLGTLSTWGWHSLPSASAHSWRDALVTYDSDRGPVPYVDMSGKVAGGTEQDTGERDLQLRGNPHRLDLGTFGLRRDGAPLAPRQVEPVRQQLALYEGVITSVSAIDGERLETVTAVHPERDLVALQLRSSALRTGLGIGLAFAYGSADWHSAHDWTRPAAHTTELTPLEEGLWRIDRQVDATAYTVLVRAPGARLTAAADHEILVETDGEELSLSLELRPGTVTAPAPPTDVAATLAACRAHWRDFWESGAALDLGAVADPRAAELERRVVLSQFLTAIHCAGRMPPQETGLVCNSWRGKSHLEMHWWHAAHFPLWNRPALLRRSLDWYRSILPRAREMAGLQGFAGARWPKQVGPEGEETPSGIGTFLIWQQPHLIHLVELLLRAEGVDELELLAEVDDLVTETADFMASFALRTGAGAELGPPLIPAQESYGGMRTAVRNPTYELVQWHWALERACAFKQRRGLPVPEAWAEIRDLLIAPAPRDGVYPAIAVEPYTIREDHPSMLCALGVLPQTDRIDPAVMAATLEDVLDSWDWDSTWGWDYPVMAMTAARLGRPEDAVDLLLTDTGKNTVLPSGHNRQTGSLPLYLPGNGGLLTAVALMAGGWDGAGAGATSAPTACPGFPDDWDVRAEGFALSP
ncbi:hypothetical protein [Brachybacterium sp. YJGR34]|uniref:hypothetical protein n=1 Tax=Brachybacterium sp. YJGR34 TaxID=2059911 RepID=UPI000E0BA6A0|nr:hypothetical protein [Brachybacterium sp. YJGR34]